MFISRPGRPLGIVKPKAGGTRSRNRCGCLDRATQKLASIPSFIFRNRGQRSPPIDTLIIHRRARSLRPLRAVGSLYEPEAIGFRAYSPTRRARVYEPEAAPVGERREKIKTERKLATDPSSLSELRRGRLHTDPHRHKSS
jgi:hypothetical protein